MKSMDLTVGDALYLYTISLILPDSSDLLPYKESLFLWFCIEPPRHAWRRPAIQQILVSKFNLFYNLLYKNTVYEVRDPNINEFPDDLEFGACVVQFVHLQHKLGQLCLQEKIGKADNYQASEANSCTDAGDGASGGTGGGLHGALDGDEDVDDCRCRLLVSG